jgi:chloride channel 7
MRKNFDRTDLEVSQMSPANKGEHKQTEMPQILRKGKTITIEIESQESDFPMDEYGEMSPAYKNNLNFKRAAAKMPAIGDETSWPRKDNYFMGK